MFMGGLCYIQLVLLDFSFFSGRNCARLCAGLKEPVESGKLMTQGRMEPDPLPTLGGGLRQEEKKKILNSILCNPMNSNKKTQRKGYHKYSALTRCVIARHCWPLGILLQSQSTACGPSHISQVTSKGILLLLSITFFLRPSYHPLPLFLSSGLAVMAGTLTAEGN